MICPLFFAFFVFLTVDAQRPTCLIVAPNIIHVGVEETVSVQLHGATKATSIQLFFQDQISRVIVSEKKTIILNNDNNYQAVEKLKVDRSLYGSIKVQEYVQLAATSNDVFVGQVKYAKKSQHFFVNKKRVHFHPNRQANL